MSDQGKSVRFPGAALALINAECDRTGKAFSTVVIDCCMRQLGGGEAEPAPAPKPPSLPPTLRRSATVVAPKVEHARTVLVAAEVRQGVAPTRAAPRLDTSMVAVHDGKKRPAYQKGQAGQGKAGGKMRGR